MLRVPRGVWGVVKEAARHVLRRPVVGIAAAARTADRIIEAELTELTDLCNRMEGQVTAAERSSLNRSLHLRILRISGIADAEKIAMHLSDLAVQTMTYMRFSAHDTTRSDSDHRLLLRAFRLRDAKLAQAVMRAHILAGAAVLSEEPPKQP